MDFPAAESHDLFVFARLGVKGSFCNTHREPYQNMSSLFAPSTLETHVPIHYTSVNDRGPSVSTRGSFLVLQLIPEAKETRWASCLLQPLSMLIMFPGRDGGSGSNKHYKQKAHSMTSSQAASKGA